MTAGRTTESCKRLLRSALSSALAISSGSFRSVRDTLVHILGGEWGWLTYWKAPSHNAAFLADLWDRHDTLFHRDAFSNVAAVSLKWAEVEKEQIEFVSSVTKEALGKMLASYSRYRT
jgi:hypothetical protein